MCLRKFLEIVESKKKKGKRENAKKNAITQTVIEQKFFNSTVFSSVCRNFCAVVQRHTISICLFRRHFYQTPDTKQQYGEIRYTSRIEYLYHECIVEFEHHPCLFETCTTSPI